MTRYFWYTDLHLDKVFPWTLIRFIFHIIRGSPKGVFLTGDISTGILTIYHLKLLAILIKCPIYFILGNHDYHLTSIDKQHDRIRNLCKEHSNLIWLTESDVISLNNEVGLIGVEGWYSAELGNPKYLKATMDWFMTDEFRKLPTMDQRIDLFKDLANKSCIQLEDKLLKALSKGYKKIYILTHFPPWKEATNNVGKLFEKYFLPYNVNLGLGKMIERVMKNYESINAIILAGHIHEDCLINISNNIECKVNKAKHYDLFRDEEVILI